MSGRNTRSRRSSSSKNSKPRPRVLRTEALESRMLLSGSSLSAVVSRTLWPATRETWWLVGAANAAPTVARAISTSGNGTVSGRTASLSVLGKDDGGEARLVYTWSVTAAPSGATASFNVNGSNAAKYATATFTKAGNYTLSVRIVDAGGRSVSSSKSLVVKPTLTSVGISTAGGQLVNLGSPLVVAGTSQALAARGLDQFGNALATQPKFTWSTASTPSGAPKPVLNTSGGNATIRFGKAGAYRVSVQARATGGGSAVGSVSLTVPQVLSAVRNIPTGTVYVSAASFRPTLPTFVDQFGNAMVAPPALVWSVTSLPSEAPAPSFTTSGGATSVTFGTAGTYSLAARVVDLPSASFVTEVVVRQTLTSIAVSPNECSVDQGAEQQFTAEAADQFGRAMAAEPAFAWSTSGGTISASGLLTASGSAGLCTVTAQSGLVTSAATVTIVGSSEEWGNGTLTDLVQSLDADGSISRHDMIQILRSTGADGWVDASEFSDLKSLLNQATTLNMPDYVRVLADDVVNGNRANAWFQGQTLGNLAAGSSAAQLNKLIDKWFYGADHPELCNSSLVYRSVAGSLFAQTPSHWDEVQGMLGDCYFISALGTLADSDPAAVANMFIDNGDGTFTVRFYTGNYGTIYNWSDGSISAGFSDNQGTADYVTVDRMLPTSLGGMLVYAGYGANYADSSNSLWIPLAEKAYAQWNETGKEGRDGLNAYASIQGGWMATVDAQVLGYNAIDYIANRTSKQVAINALAAHKAVTIGTLQWSGTNLGLYANHAYAIVGYNASTDRFTLYNPWGCDHPSPLTWSQLQATCSQMAVADTSGSTPMVQMGSLLGMAHVSAMDKRNGIVADLMPPSNAQWQSDWESFSPEFTPATLVANPPADVSFNPLAATAATVQEAPATTIDSSQVSSQRSRSDETGDEVLSPALIDTLLALDDLFSFVDI